MAMHQVRPAELRGRLILGGFIMDEKKMKACCKRIIDVFDEYRLHPVEELGLLTVLEHTRYDSMKEVVR